MESTSGGVDGASAMPSVQPSVHPTEGGFSVAGPVTIATASSVIEATRAQWPDAGDTIVDFSGVTDADSAALALMFKWQRDAEKKGRRVICRNIPANVMALARLYGVEELVSPP